MSFQNIDCAAFAQGLANDPNAVLLDVRTPEEYAEGHLAGARNIDIRSGDFFDQIMNLESGKSYYVYCRSGARSATASNFIAEQGHEQVFNMLGGIMAWPGEVVR